MLLLTALFRQARPRTISRFFGKAQLVSSGFMGYSHGSNDSQKTMGIIALTLFTGTQAGLFNHLPGWLGFLRMPEFFVPRWVIFACALTMSVKLQPVSGFAAETTAALIIHGASTIGMPVSTTHVIATSIMGVGASKRLSAVKWSVVEQIVWAWVLTIPATGLLGYALSRLGKHFF
jgi:PiT family inorganic phosphate transporter